MGLRIGEVVDNDVFVGINGFEIFINYVTSKFSLSKKKERVTLNKKINGNLFDILIDFGSRFAEEGRDRINILNFDNGYSPLQDNEKTLLKSITHYLYLVHQQQK